MSFCRCIRHNLIAAVQGELTKARLFYRALKLAYSVSFCRCIRHNLIAAVQGERTKNPSVFNWALELAYSVCEFLPVY